MFNISCRYSCADLPVFLLSLSLRQYLHTEMKLRQIEISNGSDKVELNFRGRLVKDFCLHGFNLRKSHYDYFTRSF